jgi:hypothetical protein
MSRIEDRKQQNKSREPMGRKMIIPRKAAELALISLAAWLSIPSSVLAQMEDMRPTNTNNRPSLRNHYEPCVFRYGWDVPSPAMALVHRQIAKRLAFENDLRRVEIYFEKKRVNAQYKAWRSAPRLTQEDVAAYQEDREAKRAISQINRGKTAKASGSKPLDDVSYDRTTGRIAWPAIFSGDARFAKSREQIDLLAARQVLSSIQDKQDTRSKMEIVIREIARTLVTMLRAGEVDCPTYIPAKRFLRSLALSQTDQRSADGLGAELAVK